jgi:hypothetical protein
MDSVYGMMSLNRGSILGSVDRAAAHVNVMYDVEAPMLYKLASS